MKKLVEVFNRFGVFQNYEQLATHITHMSNENQTYWFIEKELYNMLRCEFVFSKTVSLFSCFVRYNLHLRAAGHTVCLNRHFSVSLNKK